MRKLLAFLLFAISSFAQQTSHSTRAIYFTATHQNQPVPRLVMSELNVKGARPVALESLGDTPLWVAVLVDESGSIGRGPSKERIESISEALPIMLRSGTDNAMFAAFNEFFYVDQPGTTDVSAIVRVLKEKAEARGGSAILDAIQASSALLLKNLPAAIPRIIFLFSDCADNASRSSKEETLQRLQRSGTRLYVFKEPGDGRQIRVEQHGAEMLKMLAEKSGGRVINVDYGEKSKHRLADAFKLIEPELRSWHRVYVETTATTGANVIPTPFKIEPSHSKFEVRSQSDIFVSTAH
jgi:hypothetical protein